MKLLIHICCANCALYPVATLKKRDIEVEGLWFNPNIHPVTEYRSRLEALRILESRWSLLITYIDVYGLRDFIRNVVNREKERCLFCYLTRLEETAKHAVKKGFNAFTTSLLYSPYQKFGMIIDIGKELANKYSVEFLSEDFRPGWKEGIKMSREMGLYRQKYCGCIYSEMERYGVDLGI